MGGCLGKNGNAVFAAEMAAAKEAEDNRASQAEAEKAALAAAQAKRTAQADADAAAAEEARERLELERARAHEHARITALAAAVQQAYEAAASAVEAASEAALAAAAALHESKRSKKYDGHAAFVKTYNKFYDRVRARRAPYVDQAKPQLEDAFTDEEEAEAEKEVAVMEAPGNAATSFNGGNILTSKNVMIGHSVRPGPDWDAEHHGEVVAHGEIVGFRLMDGTGVGDAPVCGGCANVEWDDDLGGPHTYSIGRYEHAKHKFELALVANPVMLKTPAKDSNAIGMRVLLMKAKLTKSRVSVSIGKGDSAALSSALGGMGATGAGALSISQRKSVSHGLDASQNLQDKVDRKQSLLHSEEVSAKPVHERVANGVMTLPSKPSALTASAVPNPCRFLSHCMHRHACCDHHGEAVMCCEC